MNLWSAAKSHCALISYYLDSNLSKKVHSFQQSPHLWCSSSLHNSTIYETLWSRQTNKEYFSQLKSPNIFKIVKCRLWTTFGHSSFPFGTPGFKSWTILDKTKCCTNLKTHFQHSCCFYISLYMICTPINVSTAWVIGKESSSCLCSTLQTL